MGHSNDHGRHGMPSLEVGAPWSRYALEASCAVNVWCVVYDLKSKESQRCLKDVARVKRTKGYKRQK